ncbi:BamA/TamA family outer membrane protein [Gilvimarinus xylanilyticus]|uniref:BamA/TamA family outer membrane protein n=1 Tax=Gilvimarinus xylanilyticus TaxID=2944139 RepID=A0A9X2KSQ2_9GAMM|nr:BamA/TamA family outer membrane protein [Gilvimarinus xylanilyticus]MCP8899051.1 BamA/TamA family outer membrane protein [Gilvimarinus xylanilyticus]
MALRCWWASLAWVLLAFSSIARAAAVGEIPLPADQAVDEVDAAKLEGNPATSVFARWPEDLVLAPVPGHSSELGWSLALGAGYFLPQESDDQPASIVGAMAMGAENGSHAAGLGGSFHWLQDRLRLVVLAGDLTYNYRFWGIGNDAGQNGRHLDIRQDGQFGYALVMYELFQHFYTGIGVLGGRSEVALRHWSPPVSELPDPSLELTLGAFEMTSKIDTRDDLYFPTRGSMTKLSYSLYRDWMGSDFSAEIGKFDTNIYRPVAQGDVIAVRAMYRTASGDAPFFLLSSFGGKTDLRGYDTGRYRDKDMYAVQGEYRWRLNPRWVLTGFAGVGEVASSPREFFHNPLPAAGVGARYMLSRKHQVSLSADWAVGKNGSQFYFGIGEAF